MSCSFGVDLSDFSMASNKILGNFREKDENDTCLVHVHHVVRILGCHANQSFW